MMVAWASGWVALVVILGLLGLPRWRTRRPKWSTIACAVGFIVLPPLEQWAIYRIGRLGPSNEPVGGLIGGSIIAMAMWKYYVVPFVALWIIYLVVLGRRRRSRVRPDAHTR